MYRFSRSIFRSLSPRIVGSGPEARSAREEVLTACESTISRLVIDRRYFARPSRSLFNQVRHYFTIEDQLFVWTVIDRNVSLATNYLDRMPSEQAALLGPHSCRALTRQGTACRRLPLPGHEFCPSHRHLEEAFGSDFVKG
jgi:hypothetical protein